MTALSHSPREPYSLAHTPKEVIDIFTGTQQSAARVHEGHTKTIVKRSPYPLLCLSLPQ